MNPDRDAGHPSVALLLSIVSGSIDGLGYVLLSVFTAHITGNTVRMATAFGHETVALAAESAYAIGVFVLGIALGAALRNGAERRRLPSRSMVLGAVLALLLAFLLAGWHLHAVAGVRPDRWGFWLLVGLATLAMGMQNSVGPRAGGRQVRTFITGTMTEFAESVVDALSVRERPLRRVALRRAGVLLAVWGSYAVGGVVSGFAGTRWGAVATLFPIAVLIIAIGQDLALERAEHR